MTIFSLIFVVGVTPSITVVSGHLGLHTFGDDDGVYVSSCRHGRCSGLTYHRLSSVRGRHRFDGDDDMIGDSSAKSIGGDNYDDEDEAVGRFRELEEDHRIMTFPYCSTMNVDECRSLLQRLERLRVRRLREDTKRNVVVTGIDGTVVRLRGRRRRSTQEEDIGNERKSETPKTRAVRSHNANAAFEANRLLDQYRAWRKENGYGRNYARWGRASATEDSEEQRTAQQSSGDASSNKDSLTTPNGTGNGVHKRTPRSVVVEIDADNELPVSERDMLDTYLAWRETHGYGTLAGRWG